MKKRHETKLESFFLVVLIEAVRTIRCMQTACGEPNGDKRLRSIIKTGDDFITGEMMEKLVNLSKKVLVKAENL